MNLFDKFSQFSIGKWMKKINLFFWLSISEVLNTLELSVVVLGLT